MVYKRATKKERMIVRNKPAQNKHRMENIAHERTAGRKDGWEKIGEGRGGKRGAFIDSQMNAAKSFTAFATFIANSAMSSAAVFAHW